MKDGVLGELKDLVRVFAMTIEGHLWIVVNVFGGEIKEEDWKFVKSVITTHLKQIHERNIKYHFMFDMHEIPFGRLASFQRLLTKHQHIFNACLYSTAVVTQSLFLHNAMKLALQLYTPVRPIDFFYREPTDQTWSTECASIPTRVMTRVKEFYSSTR